MDDAFLVDTLDEPDDAPQLGGGGQPVPGYTLLRRWPDAGAGDVWLALPNRDGAPDAEDDYVADPVPVRRIRLPRDEALREHIVDDAWRLVDMGDRHLLQLTDVVATVEGLALVLDPPSAAIGLPRLLRDRPPLLPGEVVTLGVGLARGLAALHAAGLTHGRVTSADVVLSGYGRPLLAGFGVAGLLGSPGQLADDVAALARLLVRALDTGAPGARDVLAVLEPALRPSPEGRRLSAEELATGLGRAVPARPIRRRGGPQPRPVRVSPATLLDDAEADPADTEAEAGSPRRRLPRLPLNLSTCPAVVRVFSVALVLVVAGMLGWASARPANGSVPDQAGGQAGATEPPPVPAPAGSSANPTAPIGLPSAQPTAPASTDWTQVMATLDQARAAAFAAPGTAPLAAVDAQGSSAWAYDAAAVDALRRQARHAVGLQMRLLAVQPRDVGSERVILDVTDELDAYRIVDSAGRVDDTHPSRGRKTHQVTLVRTPGGWRVAEVHDA